MCGLAGIYSYRCESSIDRDELLRMREHMHARGPDGEGLWVSDCERVGFGHRRLSIIDLSDAGSQPMTDPDTGNVIVFNGEIYNYRSLRQDLEKRGYRFNSNSDTEVLLKLYDSEREDLVHQLRGMFAFAIWDPKRQGMFLARDHFGIKPLYIADDGKSIRFASQVKALLAGGAIDDGPEPAGQVGFHLWGYVPEPFTMHRSIRAFPAGTTQWFGSGAVEKSKTYFDLTRELQLPAEPEVAPVQAARDLRAALLDSVRHHLVADVPVGVFLSAGLDSSTIASLAAEQQTDLRTITLGFEEYRGTSNDEVPLAEAMASQLGSTHQTQWVQKEDFQQEYATLLAAMDQPSVDGVNSYFICKAAKAAGLKVALSGLGGDELFAGYPSFKQVPNLARIIHPFSCIPGFGKGFRVLSASLIKRFTSPKYASLFEYGGSPGGAFFLRRGLFMPWELPEFLDADLVKSGWRDLHLQQSLQDTLTGLGSDRLRMTALETTWYMRNQLLRDADWASMAHSVELRVPFVDLKLSRAVIRLLNAGASPDKLAMASTPEIPLPQQILSRPKTGFSIPVRDWIMGEEEIGRGVRPWARQIHESYVGNSKEAVA